MNTIPKIDHTNPRKLAAVGGFPGIGEHEICVLMYITVMDVICGGVDLKGVADACRLPLGLVEDICDENRALIDVSVSGNLTLNLSEAEAFAKLSGDLELA